MIKVQSPVETRRRELEHLYQELRSTRFPGSGGFQETDLLHTLLIQYDAGIGLGVKKALEDPRAVDASGFHEDEDIQRDIDRLAATFPPESKVGTVAKRSSQYYDLHKKMIYAARAYLDSLSSG